MAKGGKREGAGRPKGSLNHISTQKVIEKMIERGYDPAEQLVDILEFYVGQGMITEQHMWMKDFGKYVFKQVPKSEEIDLSSNGQSLHLISVGSLDEDDKE